MAIPSSRQLWEMGVPLGSAWLEFASVDARRQISELPTFVGAVGSTTHETAIEFVKALSSGWSAKLARDKAESELRDALLTELFNDQLQAYAFRIAPSRSRSPVRIAADVFDVHDPDWRSESLSARGIDYTEIRIVDPTRIANPPKPHGGRKGSAVAIRKAIAALKSEGFDICGPRKLACDAIRRKIGGTYAKGSGLSDPNLAKYILEICEKRRIRN